MAETGFVNNGALVQYGKSNTSENWDSLILSEYPKRVLIAGDPATDKNGVTTDSTFYEGTTPLFGATGTEGLQGQTSIGAVKKNRKLKLVNIDTGNKLKVKFKNWLPMSSVTLKGYGVDRTLLRDTLCTELWRNMYSTHFNGLLAPDSAYDYYKAENLSCMTSALFSTAGFPIEVYKNGKFIGLYVIRSDNNNDCYLMDDTNSNHILIQPDHASDFWISGKYNSSEWAIYSPTSPTNDTATSIQRFLTWANGCINGTIDIKTTYQDYINLDSFIDYIILCEVVASYDSTLNNFELGTWDSNVWYIYPYDLDQTFGIVWQKSTVMQTDPLTIGWVMRRHNNISDQDPVFFELILNQFWGRVRDRYYYLRSKGILGLNNLDSMIKTQVDLINPKAMAEDLTLWNTTTGDTGAGTGSFISDNGKKWSFVYIKNYFRDRLKWLDDQFNI